MLAQLGNIVFDGMKSFIENSNSNSAIYAEHSLLDGKPRLQRTGSSLQELSLVVRFHAGMPFVNPKNELDALNAARTDGEILPLLWGNGNLQGNFVITQMDQTIEECDPLGNVISYVVGLTLREYVLNDRLQKQQEDARNNASAVGNKKPVARRKVNPDRCAKVVAEGITKIDNHAKSINTVVVEKGGIYSVESSNSLKQHLTAIRILSENLLVLCNDSRSCAHGNSDLKYRTEQVIISYKNFNLAVVTMNVISIPSENKIMSACVKNLKVAGRPFIQQTITRS